MKGDVSSRILAILRELRLTQSDMALSDLTPAIVSAFARWLSARHISRAYLNTTIARLKAVVNRAVERELVSYAVNPFAFFHIPAPPVRESDITVEELRRFRDYRPTIARTIYFCCRFILVASTSSTCLPLM